MRRTTPFGLIFLCMLGSAVSATELEILQPVLSRSNLVLESGRGQARIQRQGAATQRVNLRSNEILTTVAETRGGWTVAGVREEKAKSRLILLERSPQGTRRVAPPALQRHPLQVRPALAVRDDELRGMAWLEGPDLTSLGVRTAARVGGEWQEVTVVGPPARGSQTGLVMAIMTSGDWLLAWSAFDGKDDEILWSLGLEERWSAPRRLTRNNSAPDIMPALVSTPDGALLTWSRRIEGEYHLMMSRFRAGSWSAPEVVGPAGSLEPGFAVRDGQIFLLYKHAWPQGWAVSELSNQGHARRLAVVTGGAVARPVLTRSSSEDVELRWADNRNRAAAWEAVP